MSPALVLLPALPPMRGQLVLEPRPLFVVLDLVAPVAARNACRGTTQRAGAIPSEPSATPSLLDWRPPPRARRGRPRSIGTRVTPEERANLVVIQDGELPPLPATRADCKAMLRPCSFIRCPHHLYLDVDPGTGAIKLNFPDVPAEELWRLRDTCSLDVADRGGVNYEDMAPIANRAAQRLGQIATEALTHVADGLGIEGTPREKREEAVRLLAVAGEIFGEASNRRQ